MCFSVRHAGCAPPISLRQGYCPVPEIRACFVAIKMGRRQGARRARILKRYVTDEQRSRRPNFIATLWAAASWLFFRVARSLRIKSRYARRSRLEKQPTDRRRNIHVFRGQDTSSARFFHRYSGQVLVKFHDGGVILGALAGGSCGDKELVRHRRIRLWLLWAYPCPLSVISTVFAD
jgi:hypothetical protein